MSGTIPHVNILELEIPQMERSVARRFRKALAKLDAEQAAGGSVANKASKLRGALVEAVTSGVAIMQGSANGDDF